MINLVYIGILIYVAIYTVGYSLIIWKNGNKVGSIAISLLGVSIVLIPIIVKYLDFFNKILNKII